MRHRNQDKQGKQKLAEDGYMLLAEVFRDSLFMRLRL